MTLAPPGDALRQSDSQHNDAMSGGPPRFFAFIQLPSGTVVAGSCTPGMSRSVDGGKTWTPIDALGHVSDNCSRWLPTRRCSSQRRRTRQVDDDAVSWEFLDHEPVYATLPDGTDRPDIGTVYRLIELPDGRRLAGTDGHGVWIRDGGEWMRSGLDGMIVYSLAITSSGALLAGTRGDSIWRSNDDGATWHEASEGLPDSYYIASSCETTGASWRGPAWGWRARRRRANLDAVRGAARGESHLLTHHPRQRSGARRATPRHGSDRVSRGKSSIRGSLPTRRGRCISSTAIVSSRERRPASSDCSIVVPRGGRPTSHLRPQLRDHE